MKSITIIFIMFLLSLTFIGFYLGMFHMPNFSHAYINLFIILIGAFILIVSFFYIYKRLS